MNNYYRHLQDVLSNNITAWSVTVVNTSGSSPGSLGQKLLVIDNHPEIPGTIGGGELEHHIINYIRENRPNKFEHKTFTLKENEALGMVCGGEVEITVDPINNKDEVYIYGAGHCSIALADILAKLNFRIKVSDSRKKMLIPSKYPEDTTFVECDFTSLDMSLINDGYHVVMTYGHQHDFDVAKQLIAKNFFYLGVMGSASKAAEVKAMLEGLNLNIDRLNCPIGLPIDSHSPYEIAVSIAAEIISFRNKK